MAISQAQKHPDHLFAVLFLDVDRFKTINDSLGHVVGDQPPLRGGRATTKMHQATVSRFGGDEFAILLNGITHSTDALAVAERIGLEMQGKFTLVGHEVCTSVSLGIALSALSSQTADEILRDADTAMYRAKAQGKGTYELFDKMMHALALLKLENELRQAVEREEFEVFYQPIVELETGGISGFEALARWRHPERGLVSPAEFIPVAEATELIIPIGLYVLRRACQQLRKWQTEFPSETPLTMSVNLSSRQSSQVDLVDQVKDILNETKLPPQCLRLEITESVVMENAEAATAMLRQLRSLNVQLSIDDFGTGYSSLSYLHRFPINILKIDRSFIDRMCREDESLGIVETIAILASKLKMKVVAEGIETAEQWNLLKTLGCPYGQGHLFSKPVEAEAATMLLLEEQNSSIHSITAAKGFDREVEVIENAFAM